MIRSILASVAVLGVTAPVLSDVIQVESSGSIQAAIEGAVDGDSIEVAPGTYHEAIDFLGKAITVVAPAGPEMTIIDASGLNTSAVRCESQEWTDSVLEGFTITGGTGTTIAGKTYGGGMIIRFSDPTVRNCVFTENSAEAGGGMSLWGMSFGSIERCRFIANTASAGGSYGGAGMLIKGGDARILSCSFEGNSATGTARGGGLRAAIGSHEITNCLFAGNSAWYGGAIANHDSALDITNCTFVGNSAGSAGGGMRSVYGSAQSVVTNSIFWGNDAADGSDELLDLAGASTSVNSGTVQGGWSGAGSDVAQSDPLFVDADSGDMRLQAASPCIDAGDNSAVTESTDLAGNDRIVGGAVDVGAYESVDVQGEPCPGDIDTDGLVGVSDLVAVLGDWGSCPGCATDLDGDGEVGLSDLIALLFEWGSCP